MNPNKSAVRPPMIQLAIAFVHGGVACLVVAYALSYFGGFAGGEAETVRSVGTALASVCGLMFAGCWWFYASGITRVGRAIGRALTRAALWSTGSLVCHMAIFAFWSYMVAMSEADSIALYGYAVMLILELFILYSLLKPKHRPPSSDE